MNTSSNYPKTLHKKPILIKKKDKKTIEEKKMEKFEELSNFVFDLSPTERQQKNTSDNISKTLQEIVDIQNNEAKGYKRNIKNWIEEKLDHKIWKKYFPGQKKEDILQKATKDVNIHQILQKYRKEKKESEKNNNRKEKQNIFEKLKRVLNTTITQHKGNDIDKQGGMLLLQLANFFKDKNGKYVKYTVQEVNNGQRGEKGVTYDTWWTRNGLEVIPTKVQKENGDIEKSLFNMLVVIDEHNTYKWGNTNKPTSSTHIIYDILKEFEVINPKYQKQIKRFVDFIDKADSMYYQFGWVDRTLAQNTLFNLHKEVKDISKIYNYFQDETKTWFEILSDKEIAQLGIDLKEVEKEKQKDKEELESRENKWRFWNLYNQKFILVKDKEFPRGQEITSSYNAWLLKLFKSGDLYIYSPAPLPKKICWFDTDGNFLIIKDIKIQDLEKILNEFKFGEYADKNIKKDFLEYKKEKDTAKKIAEEKKEKNNISNEELEEKFSKLPKLEETDLSIKNKRGGVINNIIGKIAFITLDRKKKFIARFKVENKEILKQFNKGERVLIRLSSIQKTDEKLLLEIWTMEKVSKQ